jgi:hypothetical protein
MNEMRGNMIQKNTHFRILSFLTIQFLFLNIFLLSPVKAQDSQANEGVESSEERTTETENQSLLEELRNTKSQHSPKVYTHSTVEVEKTVESMLPYKQRKVSRGGLFSIQRIQYSPSNFNSMLDGRIFSDSYTDSINVINIQVEKKFNFDIFSAGLGFGYLTGSSSGEFGQSLSMTGPSVSLSVLIDGIADEPYVAPFFNVQMSNISLKEENDYLSADINYNLSSIITLGAHVQLNWLDENSAFQALNDVGLENSYLTLAIVMAKINSAQINMESNLTVPDASMDSAFKTGITLEF